MSDAMDRARRQETLKTLIEQLHAGRSVEEVKADFALLLGGVGSGEIAEMEQNLIAEGMPEAEVKRLCDVHVAVFRESLDAEAQTRPETLAGHPVHTFRAENQAAGEVLAHLKKAVESLAAAPDMARLGYARRALDRLRLYERHYLRKENLLFPFLERHSFTGPSAVMWAIHDDIRADWKALAALLAADPMPDVELFRRQLDEIFPRLETSLREMFYKEEHILFPAALERLTQQEWIAISQQEAGIGYCYVEPGQSWLPVQAVSTEAGQLLAMPSPAAKPAASAGQLDLDTGVLTAEQVNLLLTHLPVEITFVDENDRVRYYSETRDLIFPRSPAIIGRQVQNCHPPASVDRVQKILDDFRAGRRDAAEFWIHMQGRHIYIRYFALRDQHGTYRGTMEVTQEISRIRELEGERRLVNES